MTSRLDCNNALLYKTPQHILHKLQLVQNNAARLIAKKRKYDSTSQLRKDLHWLPIHQRIQYKIILLTFKCLHGLAPGYLAELVKPYNPSRSLRSSNRQILQPKTTKTVAGDRAFSASAPQLWNKLPQDLRDIQNLNSFKRNLKTHLFTEAFNG